jgi:hypothetical protein
MTDGKIAIKKLYDTAAARIEILELIRLSLNFKITSSRLTSGKPEKPILPRI